MQALSYYFKNPKIACRKLLEKYGRWIPDKVYLSLKFNLLQGYRLNLTNPRTFCEKIQWLKLYDRRPEYTLMVDKFAVKEYVASKIGSDHVIPTIGVWNSPEEIEWDALPNKFVLKCTHDSGGLVLCRDKRTLDIESAIQKLKTSLNCNYYLSGREWPYKYVPRRIIAESFLEADPTMDDLVDFKWYCFNGEPVYCQVIQNRSTNETIDFFDTDWRHQKFIGLNRNAMHSVDQLARPVSLEKQINIVRQLSENIPYCRIDLYEIEGRVYFGEITFYPASGMGTFIPQEYDGILGSLINLPVKSYDR